MKTTITLIYFLILLLLIACNPMERAINMDNSIAKNQIVPQLFDFYINPIEKILNAEKSKLFDFHVNYQMSHTQTQKSIRVYSSVEYIGPGDSIEIIHGDPLIMYEIRNVTEETINIGSKDVLRKSTFLKHKVYEFGIDSELFTRPCDYVITNAKNEAEFVVRPGKYGVMAAMRYSLSEGGIPYYDKDTIIIEIEDD